MNQLNVLKEQLEILKEEVAKVEVQSHESVRTRANQAITLVIIIMAVYILAITAFLYFNYRKVGIKVKYITRENNDIISKIMDHKGDLKVRVETGTSSE